MASLLCARFPLVVLILCGTHTVFGQGQGQSGTPTIVSVLPDSSKVQVFHDGSWSYICANQWDNRDAQVVCRMQGQWHGQGTADLRQMTPGDVILINNMACIGNESTIDDCRFDGWRQQQCPINAIGAVNCDPTSAVHVRLTEGFGPWEGRLEVESEGVWRPVCQTGFDDVDAQVVCRMLGLRSQGGTAHVEEKFGLSSQPPLIRQLDCTGNEADISLCKGKDARGAESCSNAGVECYSCGGLYTQETGTVMSEGYPLSYPRNLDCLYVIRPANEQLIYKLEFANFSTEACCDWLQVKVLTGSSNLPGGQNYSGAVSPPRLLGKAFALNFITDGSQSLEGFKVTWSPARVEDFVTVTCEAGWFTVDIDLGFLKRLYPGSDEGTIALADPRCQGTVSSQNGGEWLTITSETYSCGTKIMGGSTEIEYSNFIVDRVYAANSSLIVRDRLWHIPVHCTVLRTDEFEIHYNPFPDVGKRHASLPEVAPEMHSAHARDRREVRGSLTVEVDFPISITAFQDSNYSAVDSPPLYRRLGDDLYLRVELAGGDPDLKVVLRDCLTMPAPDSNTTYYIIQNGCASDSNTEILTIQPHHTDFRFTAFEFAGDFPRVYLRCDVRVCAANENGPGCSQQCTSSPLAGRRSAEQLIDGRETEGELYRVEFGPLELVH